MRIRRWPSKNPLGFEQDVFSRRELEEQAWTSAQPTGPARQLSAREIARMEEARRETWAARGETAKTERDRVWGRDVEVFVSKDSPPPPEAPSPVVVRARALQRMAQAASDRRLAKEIRAYAKLEELNRRWEERGRR